ncbi:MAG TPA: S41 family peptidase [Bryobacteraceae bacterium]|nr:S41 family peptidase [Bryobacteraceae bacterium]
MSFVLALLLFASDESAESIDQSLKRFIQVFAAVTENAADPVNPAQALYEGAIPGMLRQLDPHSVFFTPSQFEQLRELEKSTRKGFGSIVSLLPGRVIVLQTLPGTPSAKAGLNPGDEILAINGYRLDRLEVEQLVQLLTEARQHQVRLEVRRPGNARLLPLLLTPEDVEASNVDRVFTLRDGFGYIRATSFDVHTGTQIRDAIEKLGGASLKGLVLDLRNNPGGVMQSAVQTAALFLEPGKVVVSVRGRSVKGEEAVVPPDAKPYRFPLAVLIDGKSASASEIVAGAVEDHKRGTIIGQQSFGKGLVQAVFPLSQGSGLALTTAFYYTPNGRSIQRPLPGALEHITADRTGGITPAVVVGPEPMTRLRAFLESTGILTGFATEYVSRNKIDQSFDFSNALLDELQTALSARNIRPGLAEWSADREWIRSRLKQELFTLALGVARGDQVELTRDPAVLEALRALAR